ncbi:hypothetical protein JAAARDRAFT_37421 [Jaapia argillacea MUCL 33604]|uniref:Transmembrane protein n=1 Tax=Jaapia argillacea MUCL 33604 TaxID=933084 RepID=A0A067PNL8_9AGAM|nr:hypothetical protein JAAARDRAFT_37421 [Jaapia argillacea MUCL 33604]
MVNWQDPAEIGKEAAIFENIFSFCFGLYLWDYCHTLWFEWGLLSRQTPFKWTFMPYLVGRYSLIVMLVGLATLTEIKDEPHCGVLYRLLNFTNAISMACSSMNLAIRTAALWQHHRSIITLLVAMSLGQLGVATFFGTRFIVSGSTGPLDTCETTETRHNVLVVLYVYTIVFDFIVLVLGIKGLMRYTESENRVSRTQLWNLLYRQGIGYFLLTFVFFVPSTTLAALNLNHMMDVMLSVPTIVGSTIASGHCVISLVQREQDPPSSLHVNQTRLDFTKATRAQFTSCVDVVDSFDRNPSHTFPRSTIR